MKKNLTILVALIIFISMNAQEQTLTGDRYLNGGYGGPVLKAGVFNGKAGLISGGRGAWIINHRFAIGGGNYGTVTDIKSGKVSKNEKPLYLELNYGGFEMEYIQNPEKQFHWTIQTMVGGGEVKLFEYNPKVSLDNDYVFMVEPGLNIEVNINRWLRICSGASYRLSLGLDMEEISYSDINGFSGQITLKFGRF